MKRATALGCRCRRLANAACSACRPSSHDVVIRRFRSSDSASERTLVLRRESVMIWTLRSMNLSSAAVAALGCLWADGGFRRRHLFFHPRHDRFVRVRDVRRLQDLDFAHGQDGRSWCWWSTARKIRPSRLLRRIE